MSKCQWKKLQGKPKRKDAWQLANNGEIQFTYKEATEKWGIKGGKFKRAIEQLVKVGLIDIAKSGFGLHKDVSLYAISERWQKYGTIEFEYLERRKRIPRFGFREKNTYGKNSKYKKIEESPATAVQVSPTTVERVFAKCEPKKLA